MARYNYISDLPTHDVTIRGMDIDEVAKIIFSVSSAYKIYAQVFDASDTSVSVRFVLRNEDQWKLVRSDISDLQRAYNPSTIRFDGRNDD